MSLKNYEQITSMQAEYYSKRIGQRFGVWIVTDIYYDWESRKQVWTLRCEVCGREKVTKNSRDILKGQGGTCKHGIQKSSVPKEKRVLNNDEQWLGRVFGTEKIVGFQKKSDKYVWICECQSCHTSHLREPRELKNGTAPTCICQYRKYDESWVGKKFNDLTIIEYKNSKFTCRCVCGKETIVVPKNLINGRIVSCGCQNKEKTKERMTLHGDSGKRLYRIYRGMLARCYDPKSEKYKDYGGRGIKVCEEWLSNYVIFREWALNNGYSDELSIDRIDNDKGYSPDNCRWTTLGVQRANQRPHKEHSKKIVWEINGEIKSAIEWCKQYNISVPTVMYRINKKGLSPFEALTMNKITSGRPKSEVAI
jgi:hypothetical protein